MTSRRCLLKRSLAASLGWAGAPLAAWAGSAQGAPGSAQGAPGRAALVIGNERYRHNPLASAANDARAVAALLQQAGFAVDLKLNATLAQMTGAIGAFGQSAAHRDVGTALFYYAGHAAQLDWHNYLLPVDGDVESAGDIRKQCVDLGLVLGRLGRTQGKTSLIILDACRDDPFGARFRPSQKGMSPYDAPAGTLLAFATAPGRVAIEMPGRPNGLYTEHLLRELAIKGVRIEDALKRVRLNVRVASGGEQVPWESTSLESDVYLFPAQALSEAELERQVRDELDAWNRIKGTPTVAGLTGYLRRFPNGKFAEVAEVRMRNLLAGQEPARRPGAAGAATALRLGPGLAVPARFQGSGNPNSAGTYAFRPVWTPGDEYVFHEIDRYRDVVQRKYKVVVRRVDAARNRVEFADGSLADLMGGTLKEGRSRRYDVPIQINPAELQIGRKWASRFQQSGDVPGAGDYEFGVTERQKVKVPAGEFSAFRIEGQGWFSGHFARHSPLQMTRWVVPGINFAVRRESVHSRSARVLVSARQAVTG